ncbi:unnamed protein product [Trifolium pratense]|uniref:Uncharacterized protein n=1 Tax=Trifolium pratense TaxID=57577 RepID=A0ACB0KY50_TRIPR|nr:unnamed protein product [Trifolium pratense]
MGHSHEEIFFIVDDLDAEIDSMSLNGFKVTIGIGASAQVYDLRKFDKPNLSMEPCNGAQLRCVSHYLMQKMERSI